MLKKIGFFFIGIVLLTVCIGWYQVRNFNNAWFKERPNHLVISYEPTPINFQWSNDTIGNFIEEHTAIKIPVQIKGIPHHFSFQFDTGAPTTFLYEHTLESLKKQGITFEEVVIDGEPFIKNLNFTLGGNPIQTKNIEILTGYGDPFELNDTSRDIHLGTLGTDFMDDRITVIDFKNQFIQFYKERPAWMNQLPSFQPFSFKGRRLMLPVKIEGKALELFYDTGCSAFGLITSKDRYDKHTDKEQEPLKYSANRFGESLEVYHKNTQSIMEIGNSELGIERISFIDIYADYQKFMSPFTKIGGWLGNKPFIESTMIIDTQKEEFLIFKKD